MNFFKKLFCSHDYRYTGLVDRCYFPAISPWKSPQFVCGKCHKVGEIYGSQLYDIIQKAKEKRQIKIALEEDLSKYDQYKVNTYGYGSFTGYTAFYIMSCYSDIYKKELEQFEKESLEYGIK